MPFSSYAHETPVVHAAIVIDAVHRERIGEVLRGCCPGLGVAVAGVIAPITFIAILCIVLSPSVGEREGAHRFCLRGSQGFLLLHLKEVTGLVAYPQLIALEINAFRLVFESVI